MAINIGILEDNSNSANTLATHINNFFSKNDDNCSIKVYLCYDEFIKNFYNYEFNIVFLDIQLSSDSFQKTGMDAAIEIRKNGFNGEIIFTTSFKEYVFEGYNVNAFNYLIKPLKYSDIQRVFIALQSKYTNDSILISYKKTEYKILLKNIISIISVNHKIMITTTEEIYESRKTLDDMELLLPNFFTRCHKSCIINLNHVTKLTSKIIYLDNNTTQNVGRAYVDELFTKYNLLF